MLLYPNQRHNGVQSNPDLLITLQTAQHVIGPGLRRVIQVCMQSLLFLLFTKEETLAYGCAPPLSEPLKCLTLFPDDQQLSLLSLAQEVEVLRGKGVKIGDWSPEM